MAPEPRWSSRRSRCSYDNAVAESFFATKKAEIGTKVWATRAEARQSVFTYINYNHKRLHSTLKHRTPHEARVCYRQPLALAA
ncbi:integrase core domain-containing protein [Micromonospora fulviviridis]|uniref:integrase core domain-containing protein n=1 Tax=Micromonospora fulviviridis TaxID=47860 RepID=UPI003F52B5E0